MENKEKAFNHYIFDQQYKNIFQFRFYPEAFSDEDCKRIIDYGENYIDHYKGIVYSGQVDNKRRRSNVGWILFGEHSESLYDKVTKFVLDANNLHYKFEISGIREAFQYTIYDHSEEGFYDWHTDCFTGPEESQYIENFGAIFNRKLSFSILLTDPEEFEGGELMIKPYFSEEFQIPMKRGTITVFPSFCPHKVMPVTKGTRRSLVGWITGPQFK